ncbi:hypothetical protein MK805_08795 [Shimazuella sp. AN120528]|uniref:hypothetical protein n=1 Tax=Shimazuella soli TaxID=1892854 RepID=UPI001F10F4F1|nr:hypothetical protein [Shimazuella soli]MCH5585066.1 hypothetical protein [Shimazuella soli]
MQTAQELIPIKGIYNEMIETTDKRLIKVLSVSAVNTHLMSYAEEKEVLEGYESFLRGLRKPIQIARVAEPMDLKEYILQLKDKLRQLENPYKKEMLSSYIQYAKALQEDRDMIRRSRYVILDEPFSSENAKEDAIEKLKLRTRDIKLAIEEMLYRHTLQVRELWNHELAKYIHMFFDYENAQLAVGSYEKEYPYIIGQGNLMKAVEQYKRREEE